MVTGGTTHKMGRHPGQDIWEVDLILLMKHVEINSNTISIYLVEEVYGVFFTEHILGRGSSWIFFTHSEEAN
jgi:hypothetical protein